MGKTHFILLFLFVTSWLHADVLKENFITFDLNQSTPQLLLDFESDNLEHFIHLDDSNNGIVSWEELKNHKDAIQTFVLRHLHITADKQDCHPTITDFTVYRRVHQSYIKLPIILDCKQPTQRIRVDYTLFFDVDKDQKAFVKLAHDAPAQILSARVPTLSMTLRPPSLWQSFKNFLIEGIWHIWIGFDHILFLLMLIIPAVYHKLLPQENFTAVLKEVFKITTAFTLAHSITLALATLNILSLNAIFVEVAIALSVLFTALNNVFGFTQKNTWVIAFFFGLIHGFGFANVLHELIEKKEGFVVMLLGFNLGVEGGQLAIVLALLPVMFYVRKTHFYRYAIMIGFSLFSAIIALLWAIERYFNLSILPC